MPHIPRMYTGVGSRKIPAEAYTTLLDYAMELNLIGFSCRTGDAAGADQAFREGTVEPIVYSPKHLLKKPEHWAYEEVKKHMPSDRYGFDNWSAFVKALLARNMMQVLGDCGTIPSEFLLCWAPSNDYSDSSSGGTGYAIRCALAHNIPVYNLYLHIDRIEFTMFFDMLLEGEA